MFVHAQAANITKERLAGFDRPIVSEPKFSQAQCPGLKRDLAAYLHTLKASFSVLHRILTCTASIPRGVASH